MTRIAIYGHRGLPPDTTTSLIDTAIRNALSAQAPDITGISCLADGADQVFARAVTNLGGTLEAIIPATRYRDGMPEDARPEYDRLLALATEVRRLPYTESDSQAHMAASTLMIDTADTLYAVWDSQPARGYGGTPTSSPTPASTASRSWSSGPTAHGAERSRPAGPAEPQGQPNQAGTAPHPRLPNSQAAIKHVSTLMSELKSAIQEVVDCFEPILLSKALEEPERPGEFRLIHHIASRLVAAYEKFIDWSASARAAQVPQQARRLYNMLSHLGDRPMRDIEEFASQLVAELNDATRQASLGDLHPVVLKLTCEIHADGELNEEVIREMERVHLLMMQPPGG